MTNYAEPIAASSVTPLRGQRRTAAQHMVRAWGAPVFHVAVDIDLARAIATKAMTPGATVTDVITLRTARTLAAHPELNAWFEDESAVRSFESVGIGIAVAGPKGLVVPVIHDASNLSLGEITARRTDLVERARVGRLDLTDVRGGTFTISNLGMFGVAQFDAILNAPQVAILAVAGTEDRFVRTADGGAWRPIARFTLTCDHRALDGAAAATFLADLKLSLESSPAA